MLRSDDEALDEAIDCNALQTSWRSSRPGKWESTYHLSLVEALDAGNGVLADLMLDGDPNPAGPMIRYRTSRHVDPDVTELRAGSIGYRWFPEETESLARARFRIVADTVLRAARSVTVPHVVTHDSKLVRGYRIGVSAREWYLKDPWPNRVLNDASTIASYRIRGEQLD